MGLAVDELRKVGREVDAEVLAHVSPARSSMVNRYGSLTVDYEHELAQLDEQGHQMLGPWPRTIPESGCGWPGSGIAEPPSYGEDRRARAGGWGGLGAAAE